MRERGTERTREREGQRECESKRETERERENQCTMPDAVSVKRMLHQHDYMHVRLQGTVRTFVSDL